MSIRLPRFLAATMALAMTFGAASAAVTQTTSDVVQSVAVAIDIDSSNANVASQRYTINLVDCRTLAVADDEITITWTFIREPPSGALYTIKIREKGQACSTTSLTPEGSDECRTWVQQQSLTSTSLRARLQWSDISHVDSSGSCDDLSNDWDDIIIVFTKFTSTSEGDDDTDYDETRFEYATDRPAAPTNVAVDAGESTLAVSWDEVTDAESYDVFYSRTQLVEGDEPENIVSHMVNTTSRSVTITSGIETDVTYYIAVSSVDTFVNASLLSVVIEAATQPTTDFYELYRGMGGADGGCAINGATSSAKSSGSSALGLVMMTFGLLLLKRRGARRRVAR